jgi:hypothetical protein
LQDVRFIARRSPHEFFQIGLLIASAEKVELVALHGINHFTNSPETASSPLKTDAAKYGKAELDAADQNRSAPVQTRLLNRVSTASSTIASFFSAFESLIVFLSCKSTLDVFVLNGS